MTSFSATIMLPIAGSVETATGWQPGPLPEEFAPGRFADLENRSTYVDRRAADVLYGSTKRQVRWHRTCERTVDGPVRLVALEWLRLDEHSSVRGLLVVHLAAEAEQSEELLASWGRLVRWKLDDEHGPEHLLDPIYAEIGEPVSLYAVHQAPFRLAYLNRLPPGDPPVPTSSLGPVHAWQFALASAAAPGSFVPSERQSGDLVASVVELSNDWSAMVLRDGAAFVGHAPEVPTFLQMAGGAFVRSIYTDALLLAVVQRLVLSDFADRLAALGDPARQPRAVERLDAEFSRFRNRLWWQHLTQHGVGNDLLLAYGAQHRLPALMEETRSELEDYSRQAALRASRVLNLVVAALAMVGAVGVLTEVYRFFIEPPTVPARGTLWVTAIVLGLVTAFVLAYPLGIASRMLPRRSRPFVPRPMRGAAGLGRRRR